MNEIIKIENQKINNQNIDCVNARDLHSKLEVKTKFADWIKRAIDKYGFEKDVDFLLLKNEKQKFQEKIEYYVSLDMAKELCMLDDSEKGRSFRKYFIECENKLKCQNPFLNASKKDLLKYALEKEEEIEKLSLENQEKDKVIKEYIAIENNKNYTEIAKSLHLKPNKFIEKLRKEGIIRSNKEPYQEYINRGYFTIKKTVREIDGNVKHFESYLVSPKGYQYFFARTKKGDFNDIKV